MTPPPPAQLHAFVVACGFLASAGFLRFVVKKPDPAAAKRMSDPR